MFGIEDDAFSIRNIKKHKFKALIEFYTKAEKHYKIKCNVNSHTQAIAAADNTRFHLMQGNQKEKAKRISEISYLPFPDVYDGEKKSEITEETKDIIRRLNKQKLLPSKVVAALGPLLDLTKK